MANVIKFNMKQVPAALNEMYVRVTDLDRNELFSGVQPVSDSAIELDLGVIGTVGQGVLVHGDNYNGSNAGIFEAFSGYSLIESDGTIESKRLLLIGDSTTYGVGATDSGTQSAGGANLNSPGQLIAKYFNEQGVQSSAKSFVGTGGNASIATAAEYYNNTPDMSIELNGWDQLDTTTIGGELFMSTGSSTALKFTVSGVDKGAIGIPIRQYGICEYRINSGAWVEVNQSDLDNVRMQRFDIDFGSVGTHTVEIQRKSGDTVYLNYLETWNSSDKLVVIPWGARGYTSGALVSTNRPWDYTPALSSVPFDAVVINIGINDVRSGGGAGTTEATYKSRVETYIDSVLAANPLADIILYIPNDISSGLLYVPDVLSAIAAEKGVSIVDARQGLLMSDYSTANAAGNMSDTLHPSISGYDAIYDLISPIIKSKLFG